jgi:ATP-dependent RNA/DNA helicase IGHMBP2
MTEDHFSRLRRLLELESDAEAARLLERSRRLTPAEAEERGNALVDLAVVEEDAGMGGRYLIRLMKRRRSPLPWTRLDVGSPVIMSPSAKLTGGGYRGVISERRPDQIQVALSAFPDDLEDHATWRLDLAFDEIAVAIARRRSATFCSAKSRRRFRRSVRSPRWMKVLMKRNGKRSASRSPRAISR